MDCKNCTFLHTSVLSSICAGSLAVFMMHIETMIQSTCFIADPCNKLPIVEKPEKEYDFILIGAGVAGSIVASRLTEIEDWTVLLLEAGPEEPAAVKVPFLSSKTLKTVLDWNYTTEEQDTACLNTGGKCEWPRGKSVGGTGVFNGMMYVRGHYKHYDKWAELGIKGWSFKDVLPFFKVSENNGNKDKVDQEYHSFDGLLPVQQYRYQPTLVNSILEAGREIGYMETDLNGKNMTGFAIAQMVTKDGLHLSTATAYLRRSRKRKNLKVIINALVTKIIFDPSSKRAIGVEYLKDNKTTKVNVNREVIVSAGTINSPQLLLLSGIGPKPQLQELGIKVIQDLPTGQNLHNHVSASVSFTINETSHNELSEDFLTEYLTNRTGPFSAAGITQVTGYLCTKFADPDYPDIQLFFTGYTSDCSAVESLQDCKNTSADCARRRIIIRPTLLNPKSRGELKLRSSNPLDSPLIYPNYFTEKQDLKTLIEGVKLAIKLSETKALTSWNFHLDTNPVRGCESIKFGTDDYWECAIKRNTLPENHQSGTAKMGPIGDRSAVVDNRLRVNGMTNIRVIDASVFPQVPNSNPIAAIIMIAEKGSQMIKEDYKGKTKHPLNNKT